MNVAVIGRTEILYETVLKIISAGHMVPLIITSKEAPEYTKTAQDFEKLAEKIGAKFLLAPKLDTPEVREVIESIEKLDIAISLNYSSVISQDIIDRFPMGILNAHGGDLPRYRGNACQAWAIINGEEHIGLCIHRMIGGELDSGDILFREYLPININTKIIECWNWMAEQVPELFLKSISRLEQDPEYILEQQSKNPGDALRCYPRLPDDGKIDWSKSNIEILRLINASNKPYSGAFCEFNSQKMIIWDAEIYEDDEIYLSENGQVAHICSDGTVIIITGDGKLKLNKIEIDGDVILPSQCIKSIRTRLK